MSVKSTSDVKKYLVSFRVLDQDDVRHGLCIAIACNLPTRVWDMYSGVYYER